jgi:hypothetical protein
VSGLDETIDDVEVTLTGTSHTWPDDINVLLVGPTGQDVILMSGTGGEADVASVTLAFDDAAAAPLPDEDQLVGGSYQPTIGAVCGSCGFDGGPPAPPEPYGTTLSVFDGTDPNGTWSLYVDDDAAEDSGSIAGGWSLDIHASHVPSSHERELTLRIAGKARGAVAVPDGFSDCAHGVPVKVQHREHGRWMAVGTEDTAADGRFVVAGTTEPGRYRAVAGKVTLAGGDVCLRAVSPTVAH